MNYQTLSLCLPILRKENVTNSQQAKLITLLNAYYCWPGFENMPTGYWQPENFAFAPKIAKACFNELCAMSEAALLGMPIHSLMSNQDSRLQAKNMEERALLQQFATSGEHNTNTHITDELSLESAQKVLLWAWLLEERYLEISSLTKTYSESMKGLVDALGIEKDKEFSDLENIETNLDSGEPLLPPWKLVLENIALFLPQGCTIVVNHKDMAAHIADICQDILAPFDATAYGMHETKNIFTCTTDIGHLLNKSERQKQSMPWLAKQLQFIFLENI